MRNSSKRRPSQIAELLRSGGGVRAVKLILCAALFAAAAGAQPQASYRIDTFAGTRDVRDNGPATSAWLRFPFGVAVDGAGNLFIADTDNHRIRKVDSAGVITTVAGTGESGFSGDGGSAIQAALDDPFGVAVDVAGNLFIADYLNHRIRKVGFPRGHHHRGGFGFGGVRRFQRGRRFSDPGCFELPLWRGGGQRGKRLHRRYGQPPPSTRSIPRGRSPPSRVRRNRFFWRRVQRGRRAGGRGAAQ